MRTDNPQAEIILCNKQTEQHRVVWQAHRQLAETIHHKLKTLLQDADVRYQGIKAVVVYQGPGSFTGLRIGLSVANTIAQTLHVPIVGVTGDDWVQDGLNQLQSGGNASIVLPEYGAPVHITTPRK